MQFLWLWTIWSNGWITQILMMIPKASISPVRIHAFFLFLMILLSIWSIQKNFSIPTFPSSVRPVQGYKWVLLSLLVVPVLAVIFAIASMATHPGKMPEKLQRRFEWNTSSIQYLSLPRERAMEISQQALNTTRTTNK